MKISEKEEAIKLRRAGATYKEILKQIPASKSSLSYWLRNIELSPHQKERIYGKELEIRRKFIDYNIAKHNNCVSEKKDIINRAVNDIGNLTRRELFLFGVALYWAEGYKSDRARGVEFTNSDPSMIRLMIKWFREICYVTDSKIRIRIQLHNPKNIEKAIEFWSRITGIPAEQFTKPYVKISSASKQIAENILEYGICNLRISDLALLARIKGWVKGVGGPIV